MKKSLLTLFACLFAFSGIISCKNGKTADNTAVSEPEQAGQDTVAIMDTLPEIPAEPIFDIKTNLGTIRVKLYSDTPQHRDNFARLALSGFYDGLLFHRVIAGFMIQGGDPLTRDAANKARFGTGGPGYTVPAEILPNHYHKKGALAAARIGDQANPMRESSGSQFYIVQDAGACAQLDGQYTVYGETIDGVEVIDKIASVSCDQRDCPISDVKIISVKWSINSRVNR